MTITNTRHILLVAWLSAGLWSAPFSAYAAIDDVLPSLERLQALAARIQQEPRNLNLYFEYAQTANALREYDKAAHAYRNMLIIDPNLHRIRLDLAESFLQQYKYEQAEKLFKQVMDIPSIPEPVKRNIRYRLDHIAARTQTQFFNGSLSAGMHLDSNTNSSSSSGEVTILDNSFPLSGGDLKQQDIQAYTSVQFQHRYRPLPKNPKKGSDDLQWELEQGVSLYQTEQEHLDSLNLRVVNVSTGGTITLNPIRTQVNARAEYSHIQLEEASYLRIPAGEISTAYITEDGTRAQLTGRLEYRDFVQGLTFPSAAQRNGLAPQAQLRISRPVGRSDTLDTTLTYRREYAKEDYFSNRQMAIDVGHTHSFDNGVFTRLQLGYGRNSYDRPDPIISQELRKEHEYNAQATIGRAFFDDTILWTGGYQYKRVDANIQNYDYDNHRISTGISYNW